VGGGHRRSNGLLAPIAAGLTDCVIGSVLRRQTIRIQLENQDAVAAALSNKKSMMGAIQRPDFVSILARRGGSAVDHPSDECGIVPNIFRAENIARGQSLNSIGSALSAALRKSVVGSCTHDDSRQTQGPKAGLFHDVLQFQQVKKTHKCSFCEHPSESLCQRLRKSRRNLKTTSRRSRHENSQDQSLAGTRAGVTGAVIR
jgi:hypothetical protein